MVKITPAQTFDNTLNINDLSHLNGFFLNLAHQVQQRKITLSLRGDNLENLSNKLGVFYDTNDFNNEILDRLFLIGEKARHFYSEQLTPKQTGRRINIEDYGQEAFDYIFDHLHTSTKSKNTFHKDFFDKNISFKDYFNNKKNKPHFIQSALGISEFDKVYFKNYYLTLLHQLGSVNYSGKSHYVSTTTSHHIASKFSGHNPLAKKVIIHFWKPNFSYLNIRVKSGLPKYKGSPYKHQKELSLVAGILPHYIIGLELLETKELFINPNIFKNNIDKKLFIEGLIIDQTNFEEIRKLTNYKSSFTSFRGNYFDEF